MKLDRQLIRLQDNILCAFKINQTRSIFIKIFNLLMERILSNGRIIAKESKHTDNVDEV